MKRGKNGPKSRKVDKTQGRRASRKSPSGASKTKPRGTKKTDRASHSKPRISRALTKKERDEKAKKGRGKTSSGKTKSNIKKKTASVRRTENRKPKLKPKKVSKNVVQLLDKEFTTGKTPKKQKIERIEENIYSFKDSDRKNPKYRRITLQMRLAKEDIINIQEVDDIEFSYGRLLPYLEKLLKRIRKPREKFSIHLSYSTNHFESFISTGYADTIPIPEQQEVALASLIEKLVEEWNVYREYFEEFFITGISLRMYNESKPKSKNSTVSVKKNRRKKPVRK